MQVIYIKKTYKAQAISFGTYDYGEKHLKVM